MKITVSVAGTGVKLFGPDGVARTLAHYLRRPVYDIVYAGKHALTFVGDFTPREFERLQHVLARLGIHDVTKAQGGPTT